ncbi:uncharacterized protein C8A04DRAFT_35761 [Dichotomopilus funicola]|uniref:Golgi apparatus membrane protein TVP38 n=1 Tax=Dichotomopilus funicola TaxID=1934379 RepID=A0AAN6ZNY8_9PEZI|nr:hypothetical protein C8A04DRAFT_35761 [Dichotomopilus funicola]
MPRPSGDDLLRSTSPIFTATNPAIPSITETRPSTDNYPYNHDDSSSNTSFNTAPNSDNTPWTPRPTPPGARRLSSRRSTTSTNPYSQSSNGGTKPFLQTALSTTTALWRAYIRWYSSLPVPHQLLVSLAGLTILVLTILLLLYSHTLFAHLATAASTWRDTTGPIWGWIPLWLAIFATAFPPLMGYSSLLTLAGFVYGFPWAWPMVASATVAGSSAAFVASRGWYGGYVHRLVGGDRRFVALGQVLRRDGLGVLVMVRLCPLPYSLGNGFLATVGGGGNVGVGAFAVATAAATPKLLVHVFIGSRLALLAESGDTMSWGDRLINYASMFLFGLIGFAVGFFIYRRTMARAAELAGEGDPDGTLLDGGEDEDDDDRDVEQGVIRARRSEDDLENGRMVDPDELDAAALMDDDDISLWETEGGYHDAWDDEPGTGIGGGRK